MASPSGQAENQSRARHAAPVLTRLSRSVSGATSGLSRPTTGGGQVEFASLSRREPWDLRLRRSRDTGFDPRRRESRASERDAERSKEKGENRGREEATLPTERRPEKTGPRGHSLTHSLTHAHLHTRESRGSTGSRVPSKRSRSRSLTYCLLAYF